MAAIAEGHRKPPRLAQAAADDRDGDTAPTTAGAELVTGSEPATAPSPRTAAAAGAGGDATAAMATPMPDEDMDLESLNEAVSKDGSVRVAVSRGRLAAYAVDRAIGKGKFSTVYRARRLEDGSLVALKRIRLFDAMDEKSRDKVRLPVGPGRFAIVFVKATSAVVEVPSAGCYSHEMHGVI